MVAIPAEAARDFFRGNLWSDSGRGFGCSTLPGAAVWAGGAGPGHPTERTAALRADAACGSKGEVWRAGYRSNRVAAVCERWGTGGAGEKSSGRKNAGARGHHAL